MIGLAKFRILDNSVNSHQIAQHTKLKKKSIIYTSSRSDINSHRIRYYSLFLNITTIATLSSIPLLFNKRTCIILLSKKQRYYYTLSLRLLLKGISY